MRWGRAPGGLGMRIGVGRRCRGSGAHGVVTIASCRRGTALRCVAIIVDRLDAGVGCALGIVHDGLEVLDGIVCGVFVGERTFERRKIVDGVGVVVYEELIGLWLVESGVAGALLGINGICVLVREPRIERTCGGNRTILRLV